MRTAPPSSALVLTALILTSILAVPASEAAGLPGWAKTLAENPPTIGEIGEHDSRVLLRETRLSLTPDGRMRVGRRTASQALNAAADEIELGTFSFDEQDEVVRSKAWHLAPGKRAKRSRGGMLDLSTEDVFLTDRLTRFLSVDDVEKGSLVFYEFETLEQREQLAHREFFYAEVPVLQVRVVVDAPDGWTVRHVWLRQEGPEPRKDGSTWTWELRDLPVVEADEELAEGGLARAPLLVVSLEPEAGNGTEAASFHEWKDVARWYESLASGRAAVTPRILQAAQGLGTSSDEFFAHVEAVSRYVRDQVRYLANDIGKGGYQPRTADSVIENLFGDCKDKGTLLQAMLSATGLKAYPLLINSSMPSTVSRELPSLYAFDHLVLGVAVPEGVDLRSPALIEAPELGRLLVVDATDEYTSVGSLSGRLAGKAALVVAGDASTLVTLPDNDPAAHRVDRRFEADVHEDGSLTATLTERRLGDPAALHRGAYRASAQDYRQTLTNRVSDVWPGASLKDLEIVEEDAARRFVWTAAVEVPAPKNAVTAELLPLFPRAMTDLETVSLRRREVPVVYDHALTMRYESVVRGLPGAQNAPSPYKRDGKGWAVESTLQRTDDRFEGTWEMELSRRRFDVAAFDELKAFWRAARKASSVPFSVVARDTSGRP